MSLRHLQRDDHSVVIGLWNRAARFDRLTTDLFDEKTRADPDFDPDLALVADDGGRISGFAVGVLRRDTGRAFVKLLAVDPARQRRGVGTRLLGELESRLAARGARTVRFLESAPNYLVPGIDTRYEAALAFVRRAGYRYVGDAMNLSVDLAAVLPARDVPAGIRVRRAVRADETDLGAFLDAHWPSWKAEARVALGNEPPTLHLALRAGRVIGFAAWDANNRGTGWFGPMGVHPQERGSGIGCALLQCCLDDMRGQGQDAAVIAWVDNAPFYERCAGARHSRSFARFEKILHED